MVFITPEAAEEELGIILTPELQAQVETAVAELEVVLLLVQLEVQI